MKIHLLFILRKEGLCIYKYNFTNEFKIDEDLTSGFFSAIFSVAEELTARKLEILEMEDLRFIFSKVDNYIIVMLCDISLSLVFASRTVESISSIFSEYKESELFNENQVILNPDLDQIFSSITDPLDNLHAFFTYTKMDDFKDFFDDLSQEGDLIGAALFLTNGIPVYSNLSNDIMKIFLRETEMRNKSGIFKIPKMIYLMENEQKIISKIVSYEKENLLLVLFFDSSISLGIADVSMEKISLQLMELQPFECF